VKAVAGNHTASLNWRFLPLTIVKCAPYSWMLCDALFQVSYCRQDGWVSMPLALCISACIGISQNHFQEDSEKVSLGKTSLSISIFTR